MRLPGFRYLGVCQLFKGLYDLPALPLRGGQVLLHSPELPDSAGFDSQRGASDSEGSSAGSQEEGVVGMVSRGGSKLLCLQKNLLPSRGFDQKTST